MYGILYTVNTGGRVEVEVEVEVGGLCLGVELQTSLKARFPSTGKFRCVRGNFLKCIIVASAKKPKILFFMTV
jgi:hypothetical protein